jgi:hypothetical protein
MLEPISSRKKGRDMNDKISKIGLGLGAATVLLALIKIVLALLSVPLAASIATPLVTAGLALMLRSLRGSLRWPRALAAWVGGLLVGAPGILVTPILSGPGDATFWVLNVVFTGVCLILGILLIKTGFKR